MTTPRQQPGLAMEAHREDDSGVRTVLHEHVAGKPAWLGILDDLPQFQGSPAPSVG